VSPPSSSPGIVLLHGGAGGGATKSDPFINPLAGYLATHGYAVASIDYRSIQQVSALGQVWYQGAAQDADKALVWMQDNAAAYHINPDLLGLGGVSDGATISLYAAYANPSRDVAPAVLLDYVGTTVFDPLIHTEGPPAFITNGEFDNVFPPHYAQGLVNQLNAVGIYNELYLQKGVGHAIKLDLMIDGKYLFEHNLDFLKTFMPVPEPSALCQSTIGALFLAAAIHLVRRKRAK
jgi:acetyl esterase/lipase